MPDHRLPSGLLVRSRVGGDGAVKFKVAVGGELDALDAIELGRLAEELLRALSIDEPALWNPAAKRGNKE